MFLSNCVCVNSLLLSGNLMAYKLLCSKVIITYVYVICKEKLSITA